MSRNEFLKHLKKEANDRSLLTNLYETHGNDLYQKGSKEESRTLHKQLEAIWKDFSRIDQGDKDGNYNGFIINNKSFNIFKEWVNLLKNPPKDSPLSAEDLYGKELVLELAKESTEPRSNFKSQNLTPAEAKLFNLFLTRELKDGYKFFMNSYRQGMGDGFSGLYGNIGIEQPKSQSYIYQYDGACYAIGKADFTPRKEKSYTLFGMVKATHYGLAIKENGSETLNTNFLNIFTGRNQNPNYFELPNQIKQLVSKEIQTSNDEFEKFKSSLPEKIYKSKKSPLFKNYVQFLVDNLDKIKAAPCMSLNNLNGVLKKTDDFLSGKGWTSEKEILQEIRHILTLFLRNKQLELGQKFEEIPEKLKQSFSALYFGLDQVFCNPKTDLLKLNAILKKIVEIDFSKEAKVSKTLQEAQQNLTDIQKENFAKERPKTTSIFNFNIFNSTPKKTFEEQREETIAAIL